MQPGPFVRISIVPQHAYLPSQRQVHHALLRLDVPFNYPHSAVIPNDSRSPTRSLSDLRLGTKCAFRGLCVVCVGGTSLQLSPVRCWFYRSHKIGLDPLCLR